MGWIKSIGLFFASAKGLVYAVSIVPAVVAIVLGWFEGRPASDIIMILAVTIAAGLVVAAHGLWIWQTGSVFLTSRKQQDHIIQSLNDLGEDVENLDLPTAAAIWAGSHDDQDITRHVQFRGLKNAVNLGKIKATNLRSGENANRTTQVDFESLQDFWRTKGVIR